MLWLAELMNYRQRTLAAINFTSAAYDSPDTRWMRRAFIQPQAMIHDTFLYNAVDGWTVDRSALPPLTAASPPPPLSSDLLPLRGAELRYLADLDKRYGGIDAVLLWHSYPNIGVDSRNQFEMLRSLPGYPYGVQAMIRRFHERDVRVLLPYNPWDQGTNSSGQDDVYSLVDAIALIGADGFNGQTAAEQHQAHAADVSQPGVTDSHCGCAALSAVCCLLLGDTMTGIPQEFFSYGQQRYNLSLMLEAEVGLSDDPDAAELSWQLASWGYWDDDASLLSKYKWLEPRFTVNICNRWAANHEVDLLQAWLNGVGFESWENVWQIFNQLSPRDAQATRQLRVMSRQSWQILSEADVLLPHVPTLQPDVYSSFFHKDDAAYDLLTLVNTGSSNRSGAQLELPYDGSQYTFVDCYHGQLLTPQPVAAERSEWLQLGSASVSLALDVEAGGFGCVAVAPTSSFNLSQWQTYLKHMQSLTSRPLSSYSRHQELLQQQHVPVSPPQGQGDRANMSLVTGMQGWWFNVSGVEIEDNGSDYGVDVQYALFGETVPQRHHALHIDIASFYLDKQPVTRLQYYQYLLASSYRPDDSSNFLRQWSFNDSTGAYDFPAGTESLPVSWVSLEEARSYCSYYGKQLPEEWQWQYAAQNGAAYSLYPYGDALNSSLIPAVDTSRSPADPVAVDALPEAASLAWGLLDLTGNKWEWTSEFADSHSRHGIVRGGSRYAPQGSMWYFPTLEGGRNDRHGNLLLLSPSMDRSQFIGFRCLMPAEAEATMTE